MSKVEKLDKNEILKEKVREKPKQTCIPLKLTYNRFWPNYSKVSQEVSHSHVSKSEWNLKQKVGARFKVSAWKHFYSKRLIAMIEWNLYIT